MRANFSTTQVAILFALVAGLFVFANYRGAAAEGPEDWRAEFPNTDFGTRSIEFAEIEFDGATREGIPPIDDPRFVAVADLVGLGE